MKKIKSILYQYKDIIIYLLFGLLTTVTDFAISFSAYAWTGSAALSDTLAWFGAVLVAFLTNKPFVFHSNDWTLKVTIPELIKFFGGRLISGLLQIGAITLLVDVLSLDHTVIKLTTSIFVVIFNYFISKWIVFKAKNMK